VPASASAASSCSRTSTWPRPSGTGVGNSRPIGHSSNSNSPPALRATNQRSRSVCQRSMPPSACTATATSAPASVPAAFSIQSSIDGTRCGSQFCRLSIRNDSSAPASNATTKAIDTRRPERTSAPTASAPSGM
jgi:hypothetical protein